jgi:4-amino-4-deoxy-L-arabinose transferase-like glycosyltransferase
MNELYKSRTLAWTLFAVFALVSLYLLGMRTLVPPDEGRYAEIAREMFVSGDWITPRLNGLKYFEKPPLQAWITALVYTVFGLGEWQARLWTGLSGLIGVLAVGYTGMRTFGRRAGFYAALVLGSSIYWTVSSQVNSLDMGLSSMLALALCAMLLAQGDEATPAFRRNAMLACWAAMALAMLSKGLIALVLPGATLVLYTVLSRDWAVWKRLHLVKGLLLFAAIAAPWFVLVWRANPEHPYFFFYHEHVERFLSDVHDREKPWFFYFVMIVPGIVPWVGVLWQSLAYGVQRQGGSFQPRTLLLSWVAAIFLFFTASHSKLPGYILPVFPALALLIGVYLETGSRRSRSFAAGLMSGIGVLLLAFVPFMTKIGDNQTKVAVLQAFQPWVIGAGFVALVGGALALIYSRQMRRDLAVLALAATGLVTAHLIIVGFEPYGRDRAGVALLPALRAELDKGAAFYSIGTYEQSWSFYLGRTSQLALFEDEFVFGLAQEPERDINDPAVLFRIWRDEAAKGHTIVAVVPPLVFKHFTDDGLPMRIVARDMRRIIIANR